MTDFHSKRERADLSRPPWDPVGGTTPSGGGTSYLYNEAFSPEPYAYHGVNFAGTDFNQISNLTAGENALLSTVHEIAHQHGIMVEANANYWAIIAVENYRQDGGGAACK